MPCAGIVGSRVESGSALALLLDHADPAVHGGSGVAFDWSIAAELAARFPIWLAGGLTPENVAGLKPFEVFRRGITRTFQITRVFREMTVFENMLSVTGLGLADRVARERAEALIDFVNLTHLRREYAGRLSYGQQKLLEFARALMTDPALILLDEPAAGVNRTLLHQLLDHIHRLQAEGKTIVIVEHDMNVIMNHCAQIFVMDAGSVIAEGSPVAIQGDQRVIDAYFGRRRAAVGG